MTTRSLFINEADQLRAGWRIAIYLCILVLIILPGLVIASTIANIAGQDNMWTVIASTLLMALAGAAACYLALRFIDKRPFSSMGLSPHPRALRELFWGLLMGFLMLTGATLTMWMLDMVTLESLSEVPEYYLVGFAANLTLYIIVGFNEEIWFRGYFYQTLSEGTSYLIAMILISLLFGVAHMGNPNAGDHPFGIVNIVLAGLLLSYAYVQTRSLWFPIGIHISWNFTQGYIWGLPVSGTSVFKPLVKATSHGPDWITGGTFGPEGGILCTIACMIALFVMWKFIRPTDEMIRSVEDARAIRPYRKMELQEHGIEPDSTSV
ncbi:MAG: CPBP family intramembrane metalloprotease [Bacteroidetes bacterium]|nr:CPBP family intramembrane metalloprotease [Bacteroidota bacterium]